jgi:hypothetical protein
MKYPIKKSHLSFTSIKEFAESPLSLLHYWNSEKKSTDAMEIGKLYELLFLRPVEFAKKFATYSKADLPMPDRMITKSENKEWVSRFTEKAASEGKEILPELLYFKILGMCSATSAYNPNEQLWDFKSFVKFENFELFGVPFKGELDMKLTSPTGAEMISDLKVVSNAHPKYLAYWAIKSYWHWQAYIYAQAFGIKAVKYICVESEAPYNHFVFQFSQAHFDLAAQEIQALCEKFLLWQSKYYPEVSYNFHYNERNYVLPLSSYLENTIIAKENE